MGLYNAAGTRLTTSSILTTAYAPPARDVKKSITVDVYESFHLPGESSGEGTGRRLKFRAGSVHKQGEIDDAFPVATITSVSPTAAAAAGGTAITITGTYLDGVTAGALGGTALTSVVVVSPTRVTAVTPAKSAGTYALTLTDDSGTATLAAAITTS